MENRPLVSIIVVTYNSSKYILETLDSAREQTYKNIELIVTDDCSKDNTVELCKEWMQKNSGRFVRTEVITVPKNLGIAANCNRGVNAAKGTWIKFIAGDDILTADCVDAFVNFVKLNKEARVVESKSLFFRYVFDESNFYHIEDQGGDKFFSLETGANEQYNILLRRNPIHGPSVFLNKKAVIEVDGFDERFPYVDDHPMWLKLTQAGYRFYFMDRITVFYRTHDASVYASIGKDKIYNTFYLKLMDFDRVYRLPYVSASERYHCIYRYNCKRAFDILGLNRNNIVCRDLLRLVLKLNPFKRMC
ncbi:MAG: glycosyltransferase [Bacteroidetes bacterium]|nr:glycosyltransferase [Bacteroidota bacterium]